MRDALGERGEAIFRILITEFDGQPSPAFRPYFLGDKWPVVDFIVELLGAGPATPYFFVQVKATRTGYTKQGRRLKVQVKSDDIGRLVAYPAPTYIIGIDEKTKDGYLVSANGEATTSLTAISTRFPLDASNRSLLWHEVRDYWAAASVSSLVSHSRFADPEWK